MNYWLKMKRLRELFDEKHPLNYLVLESPAGQEFVRINSYDCLGMGWSDDDYPLDELLAMAEECDYQDGICDALHQLDGEGKCIHVRHSTEMGQDWNYTEAAMAPQNPGEYPRWGWVDLSNVMNR